MLIQYNRRCSKKLLLNMGTRMLTRHGMRNFIFKEVIFFNDTLYLYPFSRRTTFFMLTLLKKGMAGRSLASRLMIANIISYASGLIRISGLLNFHPGSSILFNFLRKSESELRYSPEFMPCMNK